jgi:L-methionine (R)-S-oxide reductase
MRLGPTSSPVLRLPSLKKLSEFMFKTTVDHSSKAALYADLLEAVDAITEGESDDIANMANAAALIWEHVPNLNWAGFYRTSGCALMLGPFQGKAACIRIPFGKGVCGLAATRAQTQVIADVHTFPGHIACDAASQSELVVPMISNGKVMAVIDMDSPVKARFDEEDARGVEAIARLLSARNWPKTGQS